MAENEFSIGDVTSHLQAPGSGARKLWGCEVRYTWALALLLCVVPAFTHGAAFPSGFVLIALVVLGLPTGLAALLVKDKAWRARLWRRLAVLGSVSVITLFAVSQTDKLTPNIATPIAQAIEQYRNDTGNYPVTLDELAPKYLSELPSVRVAIWQPTINYEMRDGLPSLAIPSAVGDAFANYEYNFETKAWAHSD